jgi:dTDP-4-dehydrorhamnose reductase
VSLRLVVTGKTGQVATSLLTRAAGHTVITAGRPEFDLAKAAGVADAIAAHRPDVIVNAAAYTAVDRAEHEPDLAFAVNRDGAAAVAGAALQLGVPLIHLSTDYVYDGRKTSPYVESDATHPLGVYGQSKLEGEQAVLAECPEALILRTSWVYSPFGANFVKTMLRLGKEREVVRVVDDQTGNPTAALDIADAILRIAPGLASGGLYHLAGEGHVTWCGLARHIFDVSRELGGPAPRVEAITTADYPTPARRPQHSWLASDAFAGRFGFRLPQWQAAVRHTVEMLLRIR